LRRKIEGRLLLIIYIHLDFGIGYIIICCDDERRSVGSQPARKYRRGGREREGTCCSAGLARLFLLPYLTNPVKVLRPLWKQVGPREKKPGMPLSPVQIQMAGTATYDSTSALRKNF
jgi:hypothetical protein